MIAFFRRLIRLTGRTSKYDLVIYKPDRIGDFILAYPAILSLLSRFEERKVLLIVSPQGRELAIELLEGTSLLCLETGCLIKSWSQFPRVVLEFVKLAKIRATTVVCLKHHKREVDFLYLGAIQGEQTYSLLGDLSVRRFRTCGPSHDPYPQQAEKSVCRELIAHDWILSKLSGDFPQGNLPLPSLPMREEKVKNGYILISPFGSHSKRDLRPDQVCEFLSADPYRIILLGLPSQLPGLRAFAKELHERGFEMVEVHSCKDMAEYLGLVREASFVISTETATAHIAAAYGKPGVGFLGGGHFGYFAPWGNGPFRWHYKLMDCYNCGWECIYPEIRCVTEL